MSVVEKIEGAHPLTVMPIPQPPSGRMAMISSIERTLRDPSIDIDRVRYAVDLLRQLQAEESEAAFNAAMSAAQSEMGRVRQDATNPQTKSRYASHAALDRAIRPIYVKHGFAITYDTGEAPAPEMVRCEALVTCAGHSRSYHINMPADGKGAKGGDVMTKTHATGSAVTYGRRYLLLMIFNIAVGEDDDGNAAGTTTGPITEEQVAAIQKLIVEVAADIPKFLKYFKIEQIADLPASQYQRAIDALNAKRKAKS